MAYLDKSYDGLIPEKVEAQPDIKCSKCKKESGFTNQDLSAITITDKERWLKCKSCGKDSIRLVPAGVFMSKELNKSFIQYNYGRK